MLAKIKDLTFDRFGKSILTIETGADLRETVDRFADKTVEIEIKEHRSKRSKDANAYFWTLLNELSNALNEDKISLYREYMRNVGGNFQVVCIQNEAVDDLIKGWEHNGIGWLTDTAESRLQGCTNVLLYFGSSMFDTKQMSRLIDMIIADCKEQGIDTLTPEELARLKEEWK